ncbi:MAG: hypothetical protein KC621_14905 [Myxococcales bacterium]|nr:hypothetical protein [Myxococcales bacterium]
MKLLHVLTLSTLLVGCVRSGEGPLIVREIEDDCGTGLQKGDEVFQDYLYGEYTWTFDLPALDSHLRCEHDFDDDDDIVDCDPVERDGGVDTWAWTDEGDEVLLVLDRELADGGVCNAEVVASRRMVVDEQALEDAGTIGLFLSTPDPLIWGYVALAGIADGYGAIGFSP